LGAIDQTTPLGFNEYPEASQHRDPASGGDISSPLLVDQQLRLQFLGQRGKGVRSV
jgi:hypothetical protein